MSDFKGKVVWITGASAGIGEATAYLAAQKGAKLVISARRTEELERVKSNTGLTEENIMVLPIDIEKINTFPRLAEQIIEKFGRIDILFNNAGISQRGSTLETDFEVYRKLMEINFFGVAALTKTVLPYMIRQGSGHIAATSSVSGKLGSPMRSGYCASKHALHGFFDALRSEVSRNNIFVTMICPGYIQTDISKNALAPDGNKHGKMDQNQAQGMPVEVCAAKIIRAIENNKAEIYIGGKEIMGIYLKRFLPGLLNRILVNQAPK
jgi:short-subunit dehydrogenase